MAQQQVFPSVSAQGLFQSICICAGSLPSVSVQGLFQGKFDHPLCSVAIWMPGGQPVQGEHCTQGIQHLAAAVQEAAGRAVIPCSSSKETGCVETPAQTARQRQCCSGDSRRIRAQSSRSTSRPTRPHSRRELTFVCAAGDVDNAADSSSDSSDDEEGYIKVPEDAEPSKYDVDEGKGLMLHRKTAGARLEA
eukprot:1920059-Rhodomonas_salina.2